MRPAAAGPTRRVLVPRAIGGPPLAPFNARVRIGVVEGTTMGTSWRIGAVVPDDRALAGHRVAVEAALARLVDDLSNWEPQSALSRLNRSPIGAWQAVPDTLVDVLLAARDVHEASGGAFDPTVGPAVARWGFGPRDTTLPHPAMPQSDPSVAGPGFDAIEIDDGRGVARRRADVALDLCGIAKGYAVDRLSRLLCARGAPHHLVEIGGELRGNGVKPDGLPWWVELETPPVASGVRDDEPTVVALHGLSIATSGDYRHYVDRDGRRHAHTIDPATGRPVVAAPASVTVLHADCMLADAEATAIVVLGVDAGLAYAEARGYAARVIERTAAGLRVHVTSALDAMSS